MTNPYGMVEQHEYTEHEKFICLTIPNLIVFDYFKHYKQMSLSAWNELCRPNVISRDTVFEKQFGNLPYKHKIFPEFGYGSIIVIECKKKLKILNGVNIRVQTTNNKLKGFIAYGWENDNITCFEVI